MLPQRETPLPQLSMNYGQDHKHGMDMKDVNVPLLNLPWGRLQLSMDNNHDWVKS